MPDDPAELQAWFTRGAETGDLGRYLATFDHTIAVLQTAEALGTGRRRGGGSTWRPTASSTLELRFAPEQHVGSGLGLDEAVEAVTGRVPPR